MDEADGIEDEPDAFVCCGRGAGIGGAVEGTFTAFIREDFLTANGINPLSVGASSDGLVPAGMTIEIDPTPVTITGQTYYRFTITNSVWSTHDMQFGQITGTSIINDVIQDIGNNTTLTKTGTGILILTQANTYTGGTTIEGGTLQLLNSAAAGTGAVEMQGSTLPRRRAGMRPPAPRHSASDPLCASWWPAAGTTVLPRPGSGVST